MHKLLLVSFILCFTYSCTKTVSTSYKPPKAISSNWDTLKQNWSIGGIPDTSILNYIVCPELDSSILLYGNIRVFFKQGNTIASFSSFPFIYFLPSGIPNILAHVYPYLVLENSGRIFLQLYNIHSFLPARVFADALNNLKSNVQFRYILIPSISAPNARLQPGSPDVNTMDYHTLCNYLNIKE